jgi:hypothetical protein
VKLRGNSRPPRVRQRLGNAAVMPAATPRDPWRCAVSDIPESNARPTCLRLSGCLSSRFDKVQESIGRSSTSGRLGYRSNETCALSSLRVPRAWDAGLRRATCRALPPRCRTAPRRAPPPRCRTAPRRAARFARRPRLEERAPQPRVPSIPGRRLRGPCPLPCAPGDGGPYVLRRARANRTARPRTPTPPAPQMRARGGAFAPSRAVPLHC